MTDQTLERKVRGYLARSAALEELRGTPITEEDLERELDRIARDTRLPDRILEIHASLGRDPVRVLECFVRPTVAAPLTRGIADEEPRRVEGPPVDPVATAGALLPAPSRNRTFSAPDCSSDDTWDNGSLASAPEAWGARGRLHLPATCTEIRSAPGYL